MSWTLVIIAGVCEVGLAYSLKNSRSFTRIVPTVIAMAFGGASFALFTFALRNLPTGTAYAVWTGIGAAGTVTVGILLLHEPATPLRLVALGLVIVGIVGLRVGS